MEGRLSMLPIRSATQSVCGAAGVVGVIWVIGAAGAAGEHGFVCVAGDVALVATVVAGVVRVGGAAAVPRADVVGDVGVRNVVSAASAAAWLAVAGVVSQPDVAGLDVREMPPCSTWSTRLACLWCAA